MIRQANIGQKVPFEECEYDYSDKRETSTNLQKKLHENCRKLANFFGTHHYRRALIAFDAHLPFPIRRREFEMPQKCICLHLRSGVKGKHGDASNEKKKGTPNTPGICISVALRRRSRKLPSSTSSSSRKWRRKTLPCEREWDVVVVGGRKDRRGLKGQRPKTKRSRSEIRHGGGGGA